MDYLTNIWFSPRKILLRYSQLEQDIGKGLKTDSKYKVIREARSVAIMLLGIEKTQNRNYWLKLVNPKEGAPDIQTSTIMTETDNRLAYQDVEVVTLESHSSEDVDDFLKRTKLSAKKAYQEGTIILCHIDNNITTKPWKEISENLSKLNTKYQIYLLGRIDSKKIEYQLARISPSLDNAIIFDATEEAYKLRTVGDTMKFIRGTKPAKRKENKKYEPF